MNIENCAEYTIGFCPFEEFYVDGITLKCPFIHSKSEQEEHSRCKRLSPTVNTAYAKLKEIVYDLDKKVEINNKIARQEKVSDDLKKALVECEKQIENVKTHDFDFQNLHSLLILHGRLIQHWKSCKNDNLMAVCSNCSAFKSVNKACEHKFCKKYKQLREIVVDLGKRVTQELITDFAEL